MRFLLLFFFIIQAQAQVSDFNTINFKKADSIAKSYKNEELNNLPLLAYNLTSNLTTDVERFRAIYKWVCNNIENDYSFFLKNKRKRKRFKSDSLKLLNWNISSRKTVFKKLLKDKKTVCTGYAYLVKELSSLANINCEIVNGYSKTSASKKTDFNTPNHSWNAVQLDNKWYLCDPTWSSGKIIQTEHGFTFNAEYNDSYFLTEPKLFALNHYPINKKWMLIKEVDNTFETFEKAPIVYSQTFRKLSAHEAPITLKNDVKRFEQIAFKYKLHNPVKNNVVYFIIDNGYNIKKTQPKSVVIKNQSLQLKHQFTNTGFYDVHLYIDNALISSYSFNVKR